jgi:hypothetical protein
MSGIFTVGTATSESRIPPGPATDPSQPFTGNEERPIKTVDLQGSNCTVGNCSLTTWPNVQLNTQVRLLEER